MHTPGINSNPPFTHTNQRTICLPGGGVRVGYGEQARRPPNERMPPASTRSTGGAPDGGAVAPLASNSTSSSPDDQPASSPPPTTPGAASSGGGIAEGAAAAAAGSVAGSRKRPSANNAATATPHPALEAAGFSSVAVTGSLHGAKPAFNAQGDVVACASGGAVLLLAVGTGEIITRLQGGHSRPVSALAFAGASGRHLFTAGLDGAWGAGGVGTGGLMFRKLSLVGPCPKWIDTGGSD